NDGSAAAPPRRAPAPTALSSPPAALAPGARAVRAVPQIPRVLCARGAGTRARRHHALLERVEGAVPAAAAAGIDRAPRPVGLGPARARVDGGQRPDGKQDQGDAHHFHGESPDPDTSCNATSPVREEEDVAFGASPERRLPPSPGLADAARGAR